MKEGLVVISSKKSNHTMSSFIPSAGAANAAVVCLFLVVITNSNGFFRLFQ